MAMGDQSILTCPECAEPLEPGWDSCPACGTPTNKLGLVCPDCGRSVKPHWRTCPNCKAALSGYATPTGAGDTGQSSLQTPSAKQVQDQFFVSIMDGGPEAKFVPSLELPINEGEVLGERYRIIGKLGAGGFGAVYKVHDSVLMEEMGLKVVVAAQGEGKAERAVEQILHEFRLRKRINDVSHIIKSEDPRPCDYKGLSLVLLPMELADGGSFRQWLTTNRDKDRRRKDGLDLFKHACQGVKAIHDAGLVHMDIKPENTLLVNGIAKVTDFGIGRFAGLGFENNPDQLLHQGVGTPQYMSPEQFQTARQKDIDLRSDIYSLGLILYEILDGGLPFDGSPIELREKHLNMEPPPLRDDTSRWWPVVDRCLKKQPGDRYPSVESMLKDLERLEQGSALSVDVACLQCRHINSNPNQRLCEKCGADLSSLFRPCPRCAREVRLDTDVCPGCGERVLAYYVLQERWGKVEKLKDVDLAEAIDLLEVVLHDGAGEYQEQAIQLIRQLREKQTIVSKLIFQAGKSEMEGRPEEALTSWRMIISEVPRHRAANKKITEIEQVLAKFNDLETKAFGLMDQAKFDRAFALFQECLKIIPSRRQVNEHLDACRERSRKYASEYEMALTSYKSKTLVPALKYLQSALMLAPKKFRSIKSSFRNYAGVKRSGYLS